MKALSVKTKITTAICLCLLGVFGAMALTIGHLQQATLTDLCAGNSRDLGWSLSKTVDDIMMNGENEKIQPLTTDVVSRGILQELTIIDGDRVVRRSSATASIGKPAADSLWTQLFTSGRDTTFAAVVNDTPVQVTYHVFANTEACAQCHDMKDQPILGGMKMARSNQMLADAVSSGYLAVAGLSLVCILLLVAGIPILLHRFIFKPIHAVKNKLACVADGDIETAVAVKLDDEIGQRLLGIGPLIDYIKRMADISSRIADGDLTVDSTPKSERDLLGQSCKKMITNLRQVIGQLNDNAHDVAAAARQIAAAAEQTSRGTTQQSDEVMRIAAAVEEMSANIIESSHNAAGANTLAKDAAVTAGNGGDIVASTNQGMERIAEVVRTSSDSVSRLSTSAEQIGQIINTIDDIADQTNLLALNAAIEAARAGEQGRGFAVVADEVRKLAERTAQATGEITNMIKGIQGETQTAVGRMEGGIRQVDAGKEMADKAGASLNEIVDMVRRVSDMIAQMSTSAEEQKHAAEQISSNIERISQVTRESATGAQQSAAAANQLSRQADALQEIVAKFRVTA